VPNLITITAHIANTQDVALQQLHPLQTDMQTEICFRAFNPGLMLSNALGRLTRAKNLGQTGQKKGKTLFLAGDQDLNQVFTIPQVFYLKLVQANHTRK
jgi:hypothetical protein